jgi:hypothetical protein
MRRRLLLTLLCLALPTVSTARGQEASDAMLCRSIGGDGVLQAELLFGRNIEGRANVSDAQWSDFLGQEVTPRFPDGLTVFEAAGQWRDSETGQVVREPSWIVMILAPGTPDTLTRLSEIRAAYIDRFRQQSVGLTLARTCVDF